VLQPATDSRRTLPAQLCTIAFAACCLPRGLHSCAPLAFMMLSLALQGTCHGHLACMFLCSLRLHLSCCCSISLLTSPAATEAHQHTRARKRCMITDAAVILIRICVDSGHHAVCMLLLALLQLLSSPLRLPAAHLLSGHADTRSTHMSSTNETAWARESQADTHAD
jgi:hypothetical protein